MMPPKTKVPPQSIEAEVAVLGSLMLDPKKIAATAQIVQPADFYHEKHQKIFEIILKKFRKGQPLDLVTIFDELTDEEIDRIGGYSYVASLVNNTPTASNVLHYAAIVKKKSVLRGVIIAGHKILEIGEDETSSSENALSQAQSEILAVAKSVQKTEKTDINSVIDEYEAMQAVYEEKFRNGDRLLGLSSGMEKIDSMIDGIRPGHFWVVGGYTSTGKTAFSLNILNALIQQKKRVVYFSLEMTRVDIAGRIMGIITGKSSLRIMKSGVAETDTIEAINIAKGHLREANLSIHTHEHDIDQMIFAMKGEHLDHPVDCFFVDFIQLGSVKNAKSEYEAISAFSTRLQDLAKELNVPIMVLSQVNNEHAKFGKGSQVMGFKGSGAIAAAADFALELVRADKPADVELKQSQGGLCLNIDVHVKKNRHGPVGKIQMAFDGESGRFYDGREVKI